MITSRTKRNNVTVHDLHSNRIITEKSKISNSGNYSEGSIPRGVLACFLPKSRDIQGKMPSPKVIRNAFWLVTVRVLNSYVWSNNNMNFPQTQEMFAEALVIFYGRSILLPSFTTPVFLLCVLLPKYIRIPGWKYGKALILTILSSPQRMVNTFICRIMSNDSHFGIL